MTMKWIQLLISSLMLSATNCGSHSLEFLSTGRVQPGDRPQFEQLTVFDGVPISYCDSVTKREELKPSLESKDLGLPEKCDEARYNILESLLEIPASVNDTVYVIQRRRGCKQSANGIVSSFEVWAVNGMDFMSFDPETRRWTSRSSYAVKVTLNWNSKQPMNGAFRHFITEQCPQMIQNIKMKSTHQQTELHVFAKPIDDTDRALLRCHVTTSDKSLSSVHLIGDGASKASWVSVTGPVPSEDGSVILRLTAGISLNQNTNKYGCRVQTGSHNITVFWDGSTVDGRNLLYMSSVHWKTSTVILAAFCIIFVIVILVCGVVYVLNRCVVSPHRRRIDAQKMEELTTMVGVLWAQRRHSVDQDYDPEHFANQVEGVEAPDASVASVVMPLRSSEVEVV